MAAEIFVDTSGFYACLVRADDCHQKAADLLLRAAGARRSFVTTDYVLNETATLLKMRGLGHLVERCFDIVFRSEACLVEWMDSQRFVATRTFLARHNDHTYSFTDCFSFLIMRNRRLEEALTKDRHFREAGYTPLLA